MPSERGQATIDYVALIAALALLLAAAAAVAAGDAPGIANAVLAQIRHALCIVTGGACPAEGRLPCVVASRRDTQHGDVTIAIVRLDGDRVVLRERLSDGTVRLTIGHRAGAGVWIGVGARANLKIKGRTVGIDDEAGGGGEGVLGYGEIYLARDDREADEILRSIRRRIPLIGGGGPHPNAVFFDGGVRGLGRLGLGGSVAGTSLGGVSEEIVSGRRDEASGEVTISMNAEGWGWGLLHAFMAGPAGSFERHVGLSVTLDRDQHPIELSLSASGTLTGGSTLPTSFAGALGIPGDDDAKLNLTGRRWELGARADLRDADVAAAWAAFRHDPANPAAIRALAAVLRTRAQVDVRIYAVSSESDGAAAGLSFGLKLGGEFDRTTDRSRLLSAATRPPGGAWERRVDCVPA